MSKMKDEAVCWMPETEEDRRRVQEELSAILSSKHFRNSKRYPALLRYVVEKTLDGQADQLKERTLGIEVFDRRPDYDTNADPVVRFSAGEIRKRIAQYYHEVEEDSDLHIELPLGSYAPEFRMKIEPGLSQFSSDSDPKRIGTAVGLDSLSVMPLAVVPISAAVSSLKERRLPYAVAAVLLVLFLGIVSFMARRALRPSVTDAMWSSMLTTQGPVLIIVGSGNLELVAPEPPLTNLYDHMIGPYHHISVSSGIALSRLTNTLEKRNENYTVKEANATSLTDLRERSAIMIGALNNAWTLRLTDTLRFRFIHGPSARIEDTTNPQNKDWTVDFSQPFSAVTRDYAIVARYRDTATNGTVMIIAGLGPYGTEAASEFVASPQYLDQISRQLPGQWKDKNIEMVIRTDVIAGEAGPPSLVAVSSW